MGSMEKWLSLSKGKGDAFDLEDPDFEVGLSGEPRHLALSMATNAIARNPYVFVASLALHSGYHIYHQFDSRGGDGPSGSTPTSIVPSKRRQGRASAEPGKYGRPPSTRKESRARRKACPKGHYWSYKKKKCLKSKFR